MRWIFNCWLTVASACRTLPPDSYLCMSMCVCVCGCSCRAGSYWQHSHLQLNIIFCFCFFFVAYVTLALTSSLTIWNSLSLVWVHIGWDTAVFSIWHLLIFVDLYVFMCARMCSKVPQMELANFVSKILIEPLTNCCCVMQWIPTERRDIWSVRAQKYANINAFSMFVCVCLYLSGFKYLGFSVDIWQFNISLCFPWRNVNSIVQLFKW